MDVISEALKLLKEDVELEDETLGDRFSYSELDEIEKIIKDKFLGVHGYYKEQAEYDHYGYHNDFSVRAQDTEFTGENWFGLKVETVSDYPDDYRGSVNEHSGWVKIPFEKVDLNPKDFKTAKDFIEALKQLDVHHPFIDQQVYDSDIWG